MYPDIEATTTTTTATTTSGSSSGQTTVCGDGVCHYRETCAMNEFTNINYGACYSDCGLCDVEETKEKADKEGESEEADFVGETIKDDQGEEVDGESYWQDFEESVDDINWWWISLVVFVVVLGYILRWKIREHNDHKK
jgi:hypothetical protein